MSVGSYVLRSPWQCGKKCGLGRCHPVRKMTEPSERRRLNAFGISAVRSKRKVPFKNLLTSELSRNVDRLNNLSELVEICSFSFVSGQPFNHLHGKRGAA